jgi:hypothetical protein
MPTKKAAKDKTATKKTTVKKKALGEAEVESPLKQTAKVDLRTFMNELNKRAYEIFQQRGGSHGSDLNDWLAAERELKKKYGIKN